MIPWHLDSICNCRLLLYPNEQFPKSRYGESATARGPNQKVFSYVIFGRRKSFYFHGVKTNLEHIKRRFPGYVMRLYHDYPQPKSDPNPALCNFLCHRRNNSLCQTFCPRQRKEESELCEIFCEEPRLDLCSVLDDDLQRFYANDFADCFGMVWRYVPMSDPLVSEWHSRDLDSWLDQRQKFALDEWRINRIT